MLRRKHQNIKITKYGIWQSIGRNGRLEIHGFFGHTATCLFLTATSRNDSYVAPVLKSKNRAQVTYTVNLLYIQYKRRALSLLISCFRD